MANVEEAMIEGPAEQEEIGEPRRITVDANNPNVEVPSSKKVQVPQEIEKKARVINFIAYAHRKILEFMMGRDADFFDLNIGDQVHNILFTSYTILLQRHNQTGGTLESRIGATDYKITVAGNEYTKPKSPILEIVLREAIARGIPFAKYDQRDPANWYGIANPLLNFLSGYALRKKELRLGHHYMPIEKRNNQEKDVELAQYGIYGVHHPLCEGVTFPPEKRASMVQSVGPITALLCYMKTDRRYSEKWADAVKRSFAHFPDIDTIMQIVKGKEPLEIRTLMSLIADVALIVTTRQATRMFPPPAAFSFIFTQPTHRVGESTYNTEHLLNTFNFSGQGAFAFYKIFMSRQWRMRLNNATDSIARQICYHSMFGTYKEDFGILAQITNHASWDTREGMGGVFRKSNTEGAVITFDPIKQKFYSKLSQANQTRLLTSSHSQLSSISCFSGKTKRKFDDAFFDHLMADKGKTSGGRSVQALVSSYAALREELRVTLEANHGMQNARTTSWRNMDVTPTMEGSEEPDLVVIATGHFFLGKS